MHIDQVNTGLIHFNLYGCEVKTETEKTLRYKDQTEMT